MALIPKELLENTADTWIPAAGFDEIKSAQMAAYLVQHSKQPTDKLKLIKLIYLAEREYLDRHVMPMNLDEFYSLKDGPIASAALNGINGINIELWSKWIRRDGNSVSAVGVLSRDAFDHLSNADISVLDAIWGKFGHWGTAKIWDFVHNKKNIPEYTPVKRGRIQIRYEEILKALGKPNADEIAEDIAIMQREAALL